MDTLVDFTTRVKAAEYIIAITAIASFILFAEILKKHPFKSLMDAGREDIKYVRENGLSLATLIAAPFTALVYVVSLPFAFIVAVVRALMNGLSKTAGGNAAFSWRPTEAYLSGRKKIKKPGADGNKQHEQK